MPWMYCSCKAYCTTLCPPPLDVPTSAARCLHASNNVRDPSSERWNCVGENVPVILLKWQLPRHLGIFYMPQIYDMGPTALLSFRRKACWGFFRPEKSWRLRLGLNPRTWVLKGSKLPLDHRSRYVSKLLIEQGSATPNQTEIVFILVSYSNTTKLRKQLCTLHLNLPITTTLYTACVSIQCLCEVECGSFLLRTTRLRCRRWLTRGRNAAFEFS